MIGKDSKSLMILYWKLIKYLIRGYCILADRTAESKLEEFQRWDKEIDIEKAKEKVKSSYPFNKYEKYVLVTTKQGRKIKDDDLLSLLKGSQINEFNPTELKVHIERGPFEFTIDVSSRYDDALETRIKVDDDAIFSDISYEVSKWIDKHKPSIMLQKWSSWFPFAAFPIFLILLLITLSMLNNKTAIYRTELSKESSVLLRDGLTEVEAVKALEIILQYESGYIPEKFDPDITINNNLSNIWLYTVVGLIILLIKPRTVIGIGNNKWKVNFYRKWAYFVLVFIPLSIAFPIIRSKLF